MKKLLLLVLCYSCLNTAYGQIERDKALHFIGGNLYGLAGAGIAKQISDGDRWWTFTGSVAGATLIGLGKEAIDSGQRNNGWDNDDLLATILGGVSIGFTIDVFTDHKKGKHKHREKIMVYNTWEVSQNTEPLELLLKRTEVLHSLTTLSVTSITTLE